ncbi:unnamed protein product [Miscanthus lutarioriparius]|uniref:Uncharacterized protein n=1 Tax=Miscanthus lutarioriparius TaxID=422564 RepID=A0A811NX29_9POAL|nr:unnamed protein product [Miscanthus lutarioriparius]
MSAAAAAAPMARKRPAPDQEPLAADANKRLRYKNLRNIDEFEVFEVLGEGAEGVVSRARATAAAARRSR